MKFFKKIRALKKAYQIMLLIVGLFLCASFVPVLIYRYIPIYYTPLMIIRAIDKDYKISHQWVPLENISPSMAKAVVRSEDGKFYEHHGFDFEAIKKARAYNEKHKKKKGASTISQQTAKNVFLWPARSYLRKAVEAYYTVLIEMFWSKDRIMEVYLNSIEFGPGIYGVEAASLNFFKKKAKNLTLSEAALLAAVLPNPIKFKANHPSAYVLKRQSKIIGRVKINKPVVEDDLDLMDMKFDEDENTQSNEENAKQMNEDQNSNSSPSSSEPVSEIHHSENTNSDQEQTVDPIIDIKEVTTK